MSDLAATGCGNNDCGCSNNRSGFMWGNGDCCSWIWLILLFSCFGGNNGCGCGSGSLSNGSSCDWLILILLISCFCGNDSGCGCC